MLEARIPVPRSPLPLTKMASERGYSAYLARLAVRSLYAELALFPKPGLVSLVDSGSHHDMNAATMMRSLFALRHYFRQIAAAGWRGATFAELKHIALQAEARMLRATQGINTHRGAIFCLGLLCAASANCRALGLVQSASHIRQRLRTQWGEALQQHHILPTSHGAQVARRLALSGAREEAVLGFPAIFEHALPRLAQTLAKGRNLECAMIDSFFCLLAHINDTNVLYRGGLSGAQLVQQEALAFNAAGASADPAWRNTALASHQKLVAARLSPGGAADLLAATYFIHCVESEIALGIAR